MHPTNCDALTSIDLFSGGGGLTVGLKRGGFRVVSAVEIDPDAYATYKTNHTEVKAYKQDIRTIQGKDLLALSQTGCIDLLAGCPPCQGFCSLTSKYHKEDERNELVYEMSRMVKEINPRAVMLENVPGLIKKGKPYFDKLVDELTDLGYVVNWDVLQVANYGVPQSRRRLVLLAGKGFKIELPEPTHSWNGRKGLTPWRTVRDAIGILPPAITLDEARSMGGPQKFNWHVVRTMSPKNVERLTKAKAGDTWLRLPKELRPACHQQEDTGFGNVYGRLDWEKASVTITGGCTTLSKGRFGHPEELRTISIREAALIQTFPSDYIIETEYMEKACNIIGNALPCDFAEILAKQCYSALNTNK
jgi:DNA (cytosine-5)-methyltransferase 1